MKGLRIRKHVWGWTALFLVVMCLPLVTGTLWTQILLLVGLYAICTLGLSVLIGYAGLVSLAQAAFWGIGAYVSAFLAIRTGMSPILSVLISIGVASGVAFGLGWMTRNLEGHYLTLATLGAGMIIHIIFNEESWLTGGPSGMYGIPQLSVGAWVVDSDREMFYLVWILLFLLLWLTRNLVRSPWGQILQAMRDSQVAAASMGVDVSKYKVQAFMFSGALAALSGSLYAHYMTFVSPELFGFKQSIEFLLMAVIGGALAITGPIWGALLLTGLKEVLRIVLPLVGITSVGPVETLAFGILLVAAIMFLPGGLASVLPRRGIGRRRWNRHAVIDGQQRQ